MSAAGRAVGGLCAAAVLLVACGAGSGSGSATDPCVSATSRGDRTVRFTSQDAHRTALLHLPPAPAGRRLPLVIALHFASGTGAEMARQVRLSPAAERAGIAVVYPSSMRRGEWGLRTPARGARDDVRQIADLLDALRGVACVDPARVVATGVSNGGGMAARLGCELSGRLAGIAPVAPGLRAVRPCASGRPLAVFEIHGLSDTVVPYRGRGPSRAGAVQPWLARWARRDGCSPRPARTRPRRGVERLRWAGCDAGGSVEHLRLDGTGHGWPGAGGPFPRQDPTGVSATGEVVRWAASVTASSS